MQAKGNTAELKPVAPVLSYASISVSNVIATTCQYEALRHVTFSVQTLMKCAKMFSVMVWSYLILKRKYSQRGMLLDACLASGCLIFFATGNTISRVAHDRHSSGYGILLMLGYISIDGCTSTVEQKVYKGYQMSSYNQVLYVSLCSLVLSLMGKCRFLLCKNDTCAAASSTVLLLPALSLC